MQAQRLATIHAFASELGCDVEATLPSWRGSCATFGLFPRPVCRIAKGRTVHEFLAALHELGHVATEDQHDPNQAFGTGRERLEWEARAWEWALDVYPGRLTKHAWAFVYGSLCSYDLGFVTHGPAFRRLIQTAYIESGGKRITM